MQRVHSRVDVYRAIASFEEQATLKSGDVVHRPYHTVPSVKAYTRGTAVTIQDQTVTDESLTVDQSFVTPFYVDDLDALQSNYPLMNKLADEAAIKLSNKIDGDVLGEYDQADSDVDDGTLGGTSGNGITVTTSNIQAIFAAAKRKLRKTLNSNFKEGDLFAAVSPHFEETLLKYLAGRETVLGDSTGMNGHIGKYFGFDLAKKQDWTVIIGLDADGNVAYFDRFQIDWQTTTNRIKTAIGYNRAYGDSTGVGDPIIETIQQSNPRVEGINYTSRSKQQLMEGLAMAIQSGKTSILYGIHQDEIESFEFEHTRTGIRYNAPIGMTDDCVNAHALAWKCYDENKVEITKFAKPSTAKAMFDI